MCIEIEIERGDEDTKSNREERGDEIKKLQKNVFAHPKHRLLQNKTQFSSKN